MKANFKIQEQSFSVDINLETQTSFIIKSSPRPYEVAFFNSKKPGNNLAEIVSQSKSLPLLLVDKKIHELYIKDVKELNNIPTFLVDAVESSKEITTVLDVITFLEKNQATKTSMLYVVGGGIVQDLGAFAGAMYKRGLPWTFIPTTLLAQGDSCVGGKTALNHKNTKNLLALFSAPRKVIIDAGFLPTLAKDDVSSGIGEIFRLCVTGGKSFLDVLIKELPSFLQGDGAATNRLIAASLLVKKAVVELDEFELDIRRSMNYGHSFGHALEALTNYKIPHGIAVAIGILIENEVSYQRKILSLEGRNLLLEVGKKIIPAESMRILADTSLDGILDLLKRDKKAEGAVLKLATLENVGQMRFLDFMLNETGEAELRKAVTEVLFSLDIS
jgi:3-dehydroquinate synthase